jgi:hypothetical protein
VDPKIPGTLNFTEKRGKFLDDACKRGKLSPDLPKNSNINFTHTQARTTGMTYKTHEMSKDYTPDFLMHTKRSPTILVSPVKYKVAESFKNT